MKKYFTLAVLLLSKVMLSQEMPHVEDIRKALAEESKSYQIAPEAVHKIDIRELKKPLMQPSTL